MGNSVDVIGVNPNINAQYQQIMAGYSFFWASVELTTVVGGCGCLCRPAAAACTLDAHYG